MGQLEAAYIVCEYNPLTNGHAWHIAETRCALAPDAVVCVMGGSFLQRGEASVVDKWARAEMALGAGADLVLELHPAYACASAERFAQGAIMAASALAWPAGRGWLSFGAECPDLAMLEALAQIVADEPEPYKRSLAAALARGRSFAAARAEAAAAAYAAGARRGCGGAQEQAQAGLEAQAQAQEGLEAQAQAQAQAQEALRSPNNLIAIEYMKAIRRTGSALKPHLVQRVGGGHHDTRLPLDGAMPSASAIRAALRGPPPAADAAPAAAADAAADATADASADAAAAAAALVGRVAHAMPSGAAATLRQAFIDGRGPICIEDFYQATAAALRKLGKIGISGLPDVSEGLEKRIFDAASQCADYGSFVERACTRRYPRTRVQRIAACALLGFDRAAIARMRPDEPPPYLRVLGMAPAGRRLLASRPKGAPPAATRFAGLRGARGDGGARGDDGARARLFMELEARATDIYALAAPNPAYRHGGQDFTTRMVVHS